MSTTTIRLNDELRERVTKAAEAAGKTTHAFIIEAIAQTVENAEARAEFHRVADSRWRQFQKDGLTVSAENMHAYLRARIRGEKPSKPKPTKAIP